MAADTWESQDLPILEAVRAGEVTGILLDSASAGESVGLDPTAGGWAVQALVEADYLTGTDDDVSSMPFDGYMRLRLTDKGRRAVGQWPAEPRAAFLAALDRHIEAATDPEEKTRLERLRAAAGDVAKQTVAGLIVLAASAAG